MKGLGAVVATADADAGRIQQRRDVVGMQTLHREGRQGAAVRLLLRRGAEDAQPLDRLQAIKQLANQPLLPGLNARQANPI